MQTREIFVVTGPTGVGKTDLVYSCAQARPSAIVNCDVGQLYTSLSIGTAKPNYLVDNHKIPHYLFDVVQEPRDFSVVEYRSLLCPLVQKLLKDQCLPVLVGGSSFYVQALFFPQTLVDITKRHYKEPTQVLWEELNRVDAVRAGQIQPRDRYRITRALDIWHALQIRPSACKPDFNPIAPARVYVLVRPMPELYERINTRVHQMFKNGWLEEVRGLTPAWHEFLLRKKFIGYDDIVLFLRNGGDFSALVQKIQQKTRNYAKRQMTFNRMMIKKLETFLPAGNVRVIDVSRKTPETIKQEIF